MKNFDFHPKPSSAVRKRSVLGGIITILTLFLTFLLLFARGRLDFLKRTELIEIDTLVHDEKHLVQFDISFYQSSGCSNFILEVLDALNRAVKDVHHEVKTSSLVGEECRITGVLEIPAGKGTFRITPQSTPWQKTGRGHRIHSLLIGNPLSGVDTSISPAPVPKTDLPGFWTYFLSLVPTTSDGVEGYQVAATRSFHAQKVSLFSSPNPMLGSLYFYYEMSPMRMILSSSLSASGIGHFFARAVGLVSGLFALVAAFREAFFQLSRTTPQHKKTRL